MDQGETLKDGKVTYNKEEDNFEEYVAHMMAFIYQENVRQRILLEKMVANGED